MKTKAERDAFLTTADRAKHYAERGEGPDNRGRFLWLVDWWDEHMHEDKVAGLSGPRWRGQAFRLTEEQLLTQFPGVEVAS